MYRLDEIEKIHTELGIKITPEQLLMICDVLLQITPCNLLVFGVGYDTEFWIQNNRAGRTVFLEHYQEWIDLTTKKTPKAEVYKVEYTTLRPEWQEILHQSKRLTMEIPDTTRNVKWDIIIVDAPKGHTDADPGRIQSIFTARQIISHCGHIFVHDTQRPVENTYCTALLKKENFIESVGGHTAKTGTFTELSHYHIKG